MILSDAQILAALKAGDLKITPLDDPENQIQPASVDLRLDNNFMVQRHSSIPFIDPMADDPAQYMDARRIYPQDGEVFIIHPGEFVLASTIERVHIPDDIVARVDGRSSLGRLGLQMHSTAGFIDPGFVGNITLEMSNVGRLPVKLIPGMRVCQISFDRMAQAATRPYNHVSRRSKYQGQDGPQPSRFYRDAELVEAGR
jgi:dCTP deaminase